MVLDEWQHIAGVADGENLRVYLDGELVGQAAYDGSIYVSGAEGLGIGDSDTALSTIKYNGLLDDLAIWSVPLSSEQVRFQYQQGLLGNGALGGGIPGDFDGSGQLDVADIDQLSAEVRSGEHTARFDLTQDGLVTEADRVEWVVKLKKTYFGDATLNGEFNSSDLVEVFVAGKYETGEEVGWAAGDWNGDGVFSSSDMVTAFVDGGYEKGQRTDVAAVPEPSGMLLPVIGFILCWVGRRHRGRCC